jgi:hypothetical protein
VTVAIFDFDIPTGFLKQLGKLADVERYAPHMLEEAAPILVRTTKAALKSVTGKLATGQMVTSVKPSRVSHNKFGWYLVVRPTGVDKKGVRNMEKAAYLQFGTSKQAPRPWIERVKSDAQPEVLAKMKEVFEREAKK